MFSKKGRVSLIQKGCQGLILLDNYSFLGEGVAAGCCCRIVLRRLGEGAQTLERHGAAPTLLACFLLVPSFTTDLKSGASRQLPSSLVDPPSRSG